MDIQRKAQELADALVQSDAYKKLHAARETVESHEAARIMLRDFHKKQEQLQKQQAEGQEVTQAQMEEVRKLYEIMNINPYLRELMEAEFEFGALMMEVQDILGKTLGFQSGEDDEDDGDEPVIEAPQKRLWTPGN